MPDSIMPPASLLEPDDVFQNVTTTTGVRVKNLQDGRTSVTVFDVHGSTATMLSEQKREHRISLLRAGASSNG